MNKLLQSDNRIFHAQDLAQIWQIANKNTLYTTLSRLVQAGTLHRIHKGMYATVPVSSIDPWLLGIKALHQYSYVSTESILTKNGLLFQHSDEITLVSSVSTRLTILDRSYRIRRLSDQYLFNPAGVFIENGVRIATPERALADLLYFNPKFHVDNRLFPLRKLRSIQKKVGYI